MPQLKLYRWIAVAAGLVAMGAGALSLRLVVIGPSAPLQASAFLLITLTIVLLCLALIARQIRQ